MSHGWTGRLARVIAEIERRLGRNLLGDAASVGADDAAFEPIPSGFEALDALVDGGLRPGLHELVGGPGAGKTGLALAFAAMAQRRGHAVAVVDVDRGLRPSDLSVAGLDPGATLFGRPTTAEQALEIALALVEAGVGLVVIDSVAAMVAEEELTTPLDRDPGPVVARLLGRALRHLVVACERHRACVVLVNHWREADDGAPAHGHSAGTATLGHLAATRWLISGPRGPDTDAAGQSEVVLLKRRYGTGPQRAVFAWRDADETQSGAMRP